MLLAEMYQEFTMLFPRICATEAERTTTKKSITRWAKEKGDLSQKEKKK